MKTMIDRLLELLKDTKQGFILDRTSVRTDKSLGTIISWEDKDRLISELEATQWIKVEDELPPIKKPLLVKLKTWGSVVPMIRYDDADGWYWLKWNGLAGMNDLESYDDADDWDVIEWRLLPQAPKED